MRRGRGRQKFTRKFPRNFRQGNSTTYSQTHTITVCPDGWTISQDEQYTFVDVRHQPSKVLDEAEEWNSGTPVPPQAGAANYFIASCRPLLGNMRALYEFARLQSIDIRIEWLGQLVQNVAATDFPPGATGGIGSTFSVAHNTHGATLLAKVCHERLDKMRNDGANLAALAPNDLFGMNRLPVIFSPDKEIIDGARGSAGSHVLLSHPGVKSLRFTPERRFVNLKYKPLNNIEKAAATFRGQAVANPNYDNDARLGTLWLAAPTGLQGLSFWAPGDGVQTQTRTCEYYRISYTWNWKFFGHRFAQTMYA